MRTFPVADKDVEKMLRTLAQENPDPLVQDEINAHLSRSWVAAVMGQPSRKDKSQPRSFDYSKKKINDVLEWRKKNELLASDIQDRIETDGDPKQGGKYVYELETGAFYWHGTDADGCPNLWCREELMGWENINIERRMKHVGLVLQSVINEMPPHIHNINFILLLDEFKTIHAVRHPRLGLKFLETFMKCCPDRLKCAVMVTGTAGGLFYNIAKQFAPKSLVDKIKVTKNRGDAGRYIIEKGILVGDDGSTSTSSHCSSSTMATSDDSITSTSSSLRTERVLPTFLGGRAVHAEEITKSIPLMVEALRNSMECSPPKTVSLKQRQL